MYAVLQRVFFFQKCGHSLAIHRVCFIWVVAFRTTVKEIAVTLVCSARLCASPIDRKCSYPLLTDDGLRIRSLQVPR